ncbi:MAG: hypothetical protein ACYDCL_21875 [Myxococcales bacterium]
MSLVPGEEVGFLDHVAEFFLAHKGAALMLAPPDVDLVRRYEGEGVPFEVLCRGIERAFELRGRHGRERTPQLSLRACKRSIDAAVRGWRRGALRGAGPIADPALIDRLLGEARAAAGTPRGLAYRAAYRAACAGDEIAAAAAFAYLSALPRAEQRRLCRPAVDALPAGVPPWQKRASVREALTRAACEHGRLSFS